MEAMIETVRLRKSFGAIHAVDDLSFTVAKGEVLGFLGPNGAGKSTTMKILTCFLPPDGGTARVCGADIGEAPRAVREAVGYLPESVPAYAEMTVQGFLEFVGRVRGKRGAELTKAVDRVVELCHLDEVRRQQFETLSKGFKRRTCLAQALIHDPPVLILDEPTDGLDPNQKHEVRKLIAGMAEEKCVVLSTHILEEVDAVCTRAVIIDRGRLVADCSPAELRARSPRHGAVTVGLPGVDADAAATKLREVKGVAGVEHADGALTVLPEAGCSIAVELAACIRDQSWEVAEFHVEQGHLDDVFRSITTAGGTT